MLHLNPVTVHDSYIAAAHTTVKYDPYYTLFSLLAVPKKCALFATEDGVSLMTLDGTVKFLLTPLRTSPSDVSAIEVDWEHSKVYWIDPVSAVIYRADLLSGEKEVVVDKGLFRPTAIALDWAGQKLYWADSETRRIEISYTDGSSRRVLVDGSAANEVTSLAVDPKQR